MLFLPFGAGVMITNSLNIISFTSFLPFIIQRNWINVQYPFTDLRSATLSNLFRMLPQGQGPGMKRL